MMTAHAAIPTALLLAYIPRFYAASGMAQQPGGYDNQSPRDQQQSLQGKFKRAIFAHQNGLEGFAAFAAAVLVATASPSYASRASLVDGLSFGYCALRLLYFGFYVGDLAVARSAVWTGGFLVVFALFGAGLVP